MQIFSYFDLELELELGHRGWCLARLWIKKSNQSADTPLQTGFSASVLNKGKIVQIVDISKSEDKKAKNKTLTDF